MHQLLLIYLWQGNLSFSTKWIIVISYQNIVIMSSKTIRITTKRKYLPDFFILSALSWKKVTKKKIFKKNSCKLKITERWKIKSHAKKISRNSGKILRGIFFPRLFLGLKNLSLFSSKMFYGFIYYTSTFIHYALKYLGFISKISSPGDNHSEVKSLWSLNNPFLMIIWDIKSESFTESEFNLSISVK